MRSLLLAVPLAASLCLPLPGAGQNPVFDYSTFTAVPDLAWQGAATLTNGRARLAPAAATHPGGLWFGSKRFLAAGFETTFQFQISPEGGGPAAGGEGLAFVVQNNALPALGPTGPGLGYLGIPNSVAVEFDLRSNTNFTDGAGAHVSVQTRGTGTNNADHAFSLGQAAAASIADGLVHTARVVYVPGTLTVFLDDLTNSLLAVPLDLGVTLNLDVGQAWFGFTAASTEGGLNHDLLRWSMATAATPLSVALNAPLDGASYAAPARVDFAATVTAGTNAITKVEFYERSRKLGEATNSPYQWPWLNVSPGSYLVTAVVRESGGGFSVSAPARVTVWSATPPIGLNFASASNGVRHALNVAQPAGVLPQRYWNNGFMLPNGSGQFPNLRDALGEWTVMDAVCDFNAPSELPGVNAVTSPDHALMKALGLDQSNLPGAQLNSAITVAGVPFPIYDVLVYSDAENSGTERVTQFRLGTNTIYLRDAAWASFSGLYVQGGGPSDAGANTPAGNYVRFNGITSNSFTLTVTARGSSTSLPRGGVNAIQIVPSVYDTSIPPQVTRGPYLQSGTPTSLIVRWRTNRPVNSRVRCGTNGSNLDRIFDSPAETTEHTVLVTNLLPNTRYFYSIGTSATNLAGGPLPGGTNFFFLTSPTAEKPTRVWVLGDSGTANANAMAVRDAYYNLSSNRYTDVWLMLGDNAYNSGTDGEFQNAVFNMYPQTLRQSVLWSVVGNHETAQSHNPPLTIPYFQIHNFPRNGEAGGLPSGTEKYYSFDYGDIHFLCIDSMTSDRSSNGVMCSWLQADLAANTKPWLIALWHHPPYTKGSHDSDDPNGADFELVEMRANVLPILESYGVDLVLSGHSHCYERSFLLQGHYGNSMSIGPTNFVSTGNGRIGEDGPYLKQPTPNNGCVYIVAGSAGQATFGTLDHPAMYISMLQLGSLILDINENQLDGRFLTSGGVIADTFSIQKAVDFQPLEITTVTMTGGIVALTWRAQAGRTYAVHRAYAVDSPVWEVLAGGLRANGSEGRWSHRPPAGSSSSFYRVVETED